MNILVLGSGAKDHAMATLFARSRRVTGVYVAPGNGGTSQIAVNLPNVMPTDPNSVIQCCKTYGINYVFIDAADGLPLGMVDAIRATGVHTFGAPPQTFPLEGDKDFFVYFTKKYHIPTAQIQVIREFQELRDFAKSLSFENSYIIKNRESAVIRKVLEVDTEQKLITQGGELLQRGPISIENRLDGAPVLVHVIMDKKGYKLLPICGDYARFSTSGMGHIIGGMGAVTPVPVENQEVLNQIHAKIIDPSLAGLVAENLHYRGIFGFSIMLTSEGPILLDYHTQICSSSAEAIAPLMRSDVLDITEAAGNDSISNFQLEISKDISVAVVVASRGYPDKPEVGQLVEPFYPYPSRESRLFFDSVQANDKGQFITTGGRCFTAVGMGQSLEEASQAAYRRLRSINFAGAWYRDDIGHAYFKL